MADTEHLISEMKDYTRFLTELDGVAAQCALAPIAEGKWPINDLVAHIMAWDVNFLETTVCAMETGNHPPLAEKSDFQALNERAAALGRQLSKEQLLHKATDARLQLVRHLEQLPVEAFHAKQAAGTDLAEFLQRNFVFHDKHHIAQIRAYLASSQV